MANKKFWMGMLVMVLAFSTVLTGCTTFRHQDYKWDWLSMAKNMKKWEIFQ